jgi:hypothetical protein
LKGRTYPRVDLSKVGDWFLALSTYGLPLTEITSRRLLDKEENHQISRELKDKINAWKERISINDPDDSEYKYFLDGIEALLSRPLESADLLVPLASDLSLGDLVSAHPKGKNIHYLSRIGCSIFGYLNSGQHNLFEGALFWAIIRSPDFNPLLQKVISDSRLYTNGFQDILIQSKDGISRVLVKKWFQYFGLITNGRIDNQKLSILLWYAIVFELNEIALRQECQKFYVEELSGVLAEKFSISMTAVDFSFIIDWLYSHVNRQTIDGFPSGRGHKGLPSKPSIQIIEIKGKIPLSLADQIHLFELKRAISFGG